MRIKSKIESQHLSLSARRLINRFLAENEGKKIVIDLKIDDNASVGHYNYLYKVVYPILRDAINLAQGENFDLDYIDELMRLKFWFYEEYIDGKVKKQLRLKEEMSMNDMVIYVEKIKHFANEYFGIVSYPGEKTEIIISQCNLHKSQRKK